MSNHACPVCDAPYQVGAPTCERGHALPPTGIGSPQATGIGSPQAGGEVNRDFADDLFAIDGRISRQKFWLMGMVIILAVVALTVFSRFVSSTAVFLSGDPQSAIAVGAGLFWIGAIAAWWMCLAVCAKRWHDRGKSGWRTLILLIPIIGPVWVLVELGFLQGDYGDNRYGGEDVSSSETVAKWTFWASLAFAAVLFSIGTWVGSRDEPLVGWGAILYALYVQYVPLTIQILVSSVGSLVIWLMSRR